MPATLHTCSMSALTTGSQFEDKKTFLILPWRNNFNVTSPPSIAFFDSKTFFNSATTSVTTFLDILLLLLHYFCNQTRQTCSNRHCLVKHNVLNNAVKLVNFSLQSRVNHVLDRSFE